MDFKALSTGMKLALVGGAVLVINLFLPWYGVFGFNANAFDVGFLAWGGSLIAIAGAVVLLLKAMDVQDVTAGEFKAEQIAVALGALGFVLILLRFLTETNLVKFGLFLGLAAAAAVAAGAYMSMKDAGLDVPGVGGRRGGAAGSSGSGDFPGSGPSEPGPAPGGRPDDDPPPPPPTYGGGA